MADWPARPVVKHVCALLAFSLDESENIPLVCTKGMFCLGCFVCTYTILSAHTLLCLHIHYSVCTCIILHSEVQSSNCRIKKKNTFLTGGEL